MIRKLVVNDGRSERELLMVGTIVVGRDPGCHINDLDPLLSRNHAEFVTNTNGVIIRDLNSRNGILVNGVKTPERALKPGDVVQMGHLQVRYVEEYPALSEEEENRAHDNTSTGAVPLKVVPRILEDLPDLPLSAAQAEYDAASAPTGQAPAITEDDTTIAVPRAPMKAGQGPGAAIPADEQETRPVAKIAPPPGAGPTEEAETRPVPKIAGYAPPGNDPDATWVSTVHPALAASEAETRAPVRPPPAAAKSAATAEARVVANASLTVTEATPNCQQIIGARPDTIVGGRLADALTRGLSFVTSGDGPSTLSLVVTRAPSGRTVTITFRAGPGTGTSS